MHSQHEEARLAALEALELLDTPAEPELDRITRLASRALSAPIALVSLIDADRQWFKSKVGLEASETPRGATFCSRTIARPDPLVVLDATRDALFRDSPLVTGAPGIRFYAGAPLAMSSGHAIGTLCVIDTEARPAFDAAERALLSGFAALVVDYIELRRLRGESARAAAIVEATPDAVVATDLDGRVTLWSRGAERLLGYSAGEMLGRSIGAIVPVRLAMAHAAEVARTGEGRVVGRTVELPALCRDGRELAVELSLAPKRAPGEAQAHGYAAIIRDVSERKAMEGARERDRALLSGLIETLPAMVFVKDAQTRRYLLFNRAGEEIVGLPREALLGRSDDELFPDMAEGYRARDDAVLTTGAPVITETEFVRQNGERRVLRTRRVVLPGHEGEPAHVLGMTEDVTDWRAAQRRSQYLAEHDALTGAVNRARLIQLLNAALGEIPQRALSLLCVDLDRFKAINDLFGHTAGDQLLVGVADALRAACGDGDVVARTGGDEFMLLHRGGAASADALARRIVAALERPFHVEGCAARVGASVGIAVAPGDGSDSETLVSHADLALYGAKGAGKGCHRFFEPAMDEAARERRALEADLRAATATGAIRLVFQPLASLDTGEVEGFEALARWRHPERGMVAPDVFIRVAEESGLIIELGRVLLRTAMLEAMAWSPPYYVAVNLSPVQLQAPGFVEDLARLLAETGLPPERLELEVTEGVLIREVDHALAILRRIKALGVRIAMDDFGSGYSSLRYFRLFPFDKVKIDRSFIAEMDSSPQALAVVQAVIGLGRGLGMPVVAEGVETAEQLSELRAEGCTLAQGYYVGRPEPIESFAHLLTRAEPAGTRAAA